MTKTPLLVVVVLLAITTILVLAEATSSCPASIPYIGVYEKVTILDDHGVETGVKYLNNPLTIKAVSIDERVETPLQTYISIYHCEGEYKCKLGNSSSGTELTYTPTEAGTYKISAASKVLTLEIDSEDPDAMIANLTEDIIEPEQKGFVVVESGLDVTVTTVMNLGG